MLTEAGKQKIAQIAAAHFVNPEAAGILLEALRRGRGQQAQFNHPDLGGMGQWSAGGMIMIGDMFNNSLKAKVDALARDLAPLAAEEAIIDADSPSLFMPGPERSRWPAELGMPSSTGSQNDMHYALFPAQRRLAILIAGKLRLFDTGTHQIGSFAQAQGDGASLSFSSQAGRIRLEDLEEISSPGEVAAPRAEPAVPGPTELEIPLPVAPATPRAMAAPSPAPAINSRSTEDILRVLDQLYGLQEKGVISAEEFAQKKAELLARI